MEIIMASAIIFIVVIIVGLTFYLHYIKICPQGTQKVPSYRCGCNSCSGRAY